MPLFNSKTSSFRRHAFKEFGRCQWCNSSLTWEESTVDHILARARGGRSDWKNLALSCLACNELKANDHWGQPPFGPEWGEPDLTRKVWESSLTYSLGDVLKEALK